VPVRSSRVPSWVCRTAWALRCLSKIPVTVAKGIWAATTGTQMLRGLTQVRFHTTDLTAAKRWYTELLGIEPHTIQPEHIDFRFGDYQHELILLDSRYARDMSRLDSSATAPAGRRSVGPINRPAGAVVYWQVDDVPATVDRLLSMGATQHEAPRDFGDGLIGASVIDPFGNILGIMYNPRYVQVLRSIGSA
jgi:catechol 2,3-dioxygenase-like lactoylglutathione lyase family enzyme